MSSELSRPEDLLRALDGVDGWLGAGEGWRLFGAAKAAAQLRRDALAVDIGSYRGRSAVALALGLGAGGGGRVITVDPQPDDERRKLEANLEAKGVAGMVDVWGIGSWAAAKRSEAGSVDVLFLDGEHRFEAVLRDWLLWRPMLRGGAFVGFNDPFWPGVNRFLRQYVCTLSSPFRSLQLVENSLFAMYEPEAWPSHEDMEELLHVGRYLGRARLWHTLDRPPERWPLMPERLRTQSMRIDARLFPRVLRRAARQGARRRAVVESGGSAGRGAERRRSV